MKLKEQFLHRQPSMYQTILNNFIINYTSDDSWNVYDYNTVRCLGDIRRTVHYIG